MDEIDKLASKRADKIRREMEAKQEEEDLFDSYQFNHDRDEVNGHPYSSRYDNEHTAKTSDEYIADEIEMADREQLPVDDAGRALLKKYYQEWLKNNK